MAIGEILAIVGDNPSPLEVSTDAAHPSINPLNNTQSFDELEPIENLAADAPPLPAPGHRSLRQKAEHIWYGLPTAAKTTLILAIVGSFLLIAYSIIAVSLRSYDEEAHVATVIIVISIFILYAAFDAVIYENTLQLIISIILSTLWKLPSSKNEKNSLCLLISISSPFAADFSEIFSFLFFFV